MKKLLLVLAVLLVGAPSLASAQTSSKYTEFNVGGAVWEGAVVDVYWNPEGFSDWFSVPHQITDPRGLPAWIPVDYPNPIFSSEEEKLEWRMQLFETVLRKHIDSANEIKESALRMRLTRASLPCDGSVKAIVICWKPKEIAGGTGLGGIRPCSKQFICAGIVLLNNSFWWGTENSIGAGTMHEIMHALDIGHYNGEPALINETIRVKELQPYDKAVIAYLYPFEESCTVSLSGDGVLELPYVWVGDTMYHATLKYNFSSERFELTHGDIQEHPVSQCGFKFIENEGTIHIAYVESAVEGAKGRFFLNLRLAPPPENALNSAIEFSVTSYGPR